MGWTCGDPRDYDREHCVDLAQLSAFLRETQPDTAGALGLDGDGPTRRKFLARVQGEISKRGTIDVLRNGVRHGPRHIDLLYGTPSPGNERAETRYEQNRFTVTRQLRYSRDETQLALDLCLFINGLPVATFELKNSLTKQTVEDAVEQYKRDRSPREKLFELGRCLAHFAVDDHEARFCTHLQGKSSWFLPFNRGWDDGAGNPPNPNGLKTDYLWKEALTPRRAYRHYRELCPDRRNEGIEKTGTQEARADMATLSPARRGAPPAGGCVEQRSRFQVSDSALGGQRQVELHSLAGPPADWAGERRRGPLRLGGPSSLTGGCWISQIQDTIKQYAQVRSVVGHAESSSDLRTLPAAR